MVEPEEVPSTLQPVPGPTQRVLTPRNRRRLLAATERIERDRREWARLVRELGVAASARALNLTPQAVSQRLRTIERD
jgi:hypothetical protein